MKKLILTLALLFAAGILSAEEDIKFRGWKQAETEHFRFIYEDASKEAAVEYAKIADDAWNKVAKIYGCPPDKLDVTVTARTNTVNAYTFFAPVSIGMFNTPLNFPTFTYRTDWKKLFFTHELVHAANLQFEDRKPTEILKKIFGEAMILFNVPEGWGLEGLTTVLETELTEGGRGRSPYFELEYKAPTLDNAFISYNEIGLDAEPPYGQIYVMGYLIMRLIADNWGIKALADIERNMDYYGSWDKAVELVTGHTGQELYTDVRIALAKKYADERKIPEGIIISPREVGTSYYKPAYIDEQGNIIALRKEQNRITQAVKLTPSAKRGKNYIQETKPEKDLNTVYKETILFSGNFSDQNCVTAAEDGTVYAVLSDIVDHKLPGRQVESFLYKWTQKEGLEKLTEKADLFQPSVSADGKTLVAVEANHMNMRLVKINLETGKIIPLLEEKGIDFLEPVLNSDGTKLAFMKVDWKRGAVCVMDMTNPQNGYRIIYNGDGKITDPSSPCWNADGNLVFTDNARGRLEAFEVTEENGLQKISPVVSDPIGILWTYKNSKGIFYLSHSSTGNVIKIKPLSEWGDVPQTEGPSPAGEKICFAEYVNDYPEFVPYEIPSQRIISEEELKASLEKSRNESGKQQNDEPVAVRGKYVKQREEEFIKKAGESNSTQTELQKEKPFFALPERFLSIPVVIPFDMDGKTTFGYGVDAVFTTPLLQQSFGIAEVSVAYNPELNNISGELIADFVIGNTQIGAVLERRNVSAKNDGVYSYKEISSLSLMDDMPLYSRKSNSKQISFSEIASVTAAFTRDSLAPVSLTSDVPYKFNLTETAGFEFNYTSRDYRQNETSLNMTLLENGIYDTDKNQFFAGVEGDISSRYTVFDKWAIEIGIFGRYTDFPINTSVSGSFSVYPEEKFNCLYPGSVLGSIGFVMPILVNGLEIKGFYEIMGQFGKNTVDGNTPDNGNVLNFTLNSPGIFGVEAAFNLGTARFAYGLTVPADFSDSSQFKYYTSIRIGPVRKRFNG